MMKCRLRESRLIAINEGERSLIAADVSAVYQINGDEIKHSAPDRMLEHVLRFGLARPTINSGLQTGIPICHNRAFGELAGTCAVTAFENIAGMQRFKISISPAVPTVANMQSVFVSVCLR
jgi:hypothetical protein